MARTRGTTGTAAAENERMPSRGDQIDLTRRAQTKTLVLQTSTVVLAAVALAYFNIIDHRLAMVIIVAMYLTIRFFA